MKILFFSDIHGIYDNLKYIKALDDKNKFDKIVCLGDLYYGGPTYDKKYKIESKKVLEFLTSYQDRLICLRGNCDSDVDIKASDFPICNNLALINVDGINLYLTHGNEYSETKSRKFNHKEVLIYGHEHIPYIHKTSDMIYVNVGSISLPKENNNPTYAIYENKTITIYDINNLKIDSIKIS